MSNQAREYGIMTEEELYQQHFPHFADADVRNLIFAEGLSIPSPPCESVPVGQSSLLGSQTPNKDVRHANPAGDTQNGRYSR